MTKSEPGRKYKPTRTQYDQRIVCNVHWLRQMRKKYQHAAYFNLSFSHVHKEQKSGIQSYSPVFIVQYCSSEDDQIMHRSQVGIGMHVFLTTGILEKHEIKRRRKKIDIPQSKRTSSHKYKSDPQLFCTFARRDNKKTKSSFTTDMMGRK